MGRESNSDYWHLKRNTQVKHDILSDYLTRWAAILSGGRSQQRIIFHYVDGFAGKGRYQEGEPGSPLIAMKIGQKLHDHRGGNVVLNCYNVERRPDWFESLEREIDELRSRYPSVGVANFCGLFQTHSDEILGRIPANQNTFVFIDPFGYKGVELAQILKFLERRRSEVFITFMSNYIGRFMTDPNRAEAMDAIFGTGEWRKLVGLPTMSQQTAAVELYGKQLQSKAADKGKELYVLPINVQFEDSEADIYHLVHVSQHPKGRLAMGDSVDKVQRLSTQEALFTIAPEIQEYAVEALRVAPGGKMKALDLAGKAWYRSWYASWKTDFKEAIRGLEATGEVVVHAHDGRNRRTGIEEGDWIVLESRGRQVAVQAP